MWYTYIVRSLRTGEFYKGLTDNLDRRLRQHENRKSKFAKHRLPIELVHVEVAETRDEARRMEKFFKSGYGREVLHEIAGERAQVVKLVYTQS